MTEGLELYELRLEHVRTGFDCGYRQMAAAVWQSFGPVFRLGDPAHADDGIRYSQPLGVSPDKLTTAEGARDLSVKLAQVAANLADAPRQQLLDELGFDGGVSFNVWERGATTIRRRPDESLTDAAVARRYLLDLLATGPGPYTLLAPAALLPNVLLALDGGPRPAVDGRAMHLVFDPAIDREELILVRGCPFQVAVDGPSLSVADDELRVRFALDVTCTDPECVARVTPSSLVLAL